MRGSIDARRSRTAAHSRTLITHQVEPLVAIDQLNGMLQRGQIGAYKYDMLFVKVWAKALDERGDAPFTTMENRRTSNAKTPPFRRLSEDGCGPQAIPLYWHFFEAAGGPRTRMCHVESPWRRFPPLPDAPDCCEDSRLGLPALHHLAYAYRSLPRQRASPHSHPHLHPRSARRSLGSRQATGASEDDN